MLAATTPPAPGTFSTTNGLAKAALNLSARSRARTSGLPPGPEGAINRTGRVGQTSSCALAEEKLASNTTQAIRRDARDRFHALPQISWATSTMSLEFLLLHNGCDRIAGIDACKAALWGNCKIA